MLLSHDRFRRHSHAQLRAVEPVPPSDVSEPMPCHMTGRSQARPITEVRDTSTPTKMTP